MPSPSRYAGPSLSHGFAAGEGALAAPAVSGSLSRALKAQAGEGRGEGRFGSTARGGLLAALVVLAIGFSSPTRAAEIALSCGAVGQELRLCGEAAEAWAAHSGHSVRIIATPNDSDQRLALYQQLLAARSNAVDVMQIDVVWPGILARHLLDLSPYVGPEERAAHLPVIIDNNTIDGRLVALPWFVDVGLLYYRRDLLEKHEAPVPRTWEELTETARRIQEEERRQGNARLWGYVFQARAYEGLSCNALEWIAAQGGGRLIHEDGGAGFRHPEAAKALTLARSWIGTIAPEGVLTYMEDEARGVFQSGQAVFMRNWPYVWALADAPGSPIAGKVGLAPLPASPGVAPTGVLGGQQVAVSAYTAHPEAAADLARALTGAEVQKTRAVAAGFNPTRPALYRDPEVLRANPHYQMLAGVLANAIARPSGPTGVAYNRVSSAFWNAVHDVLSGRAEAEGALADLEARVEQIRGEGWPR
ncbi:MAG: ABC transporter substrate-binding protein [Rhodospirillales bacterium]|nr:ABC transporter substrate-binding protein [Rhodospirillales bacterium]